MPVNLHSPERQDTGGLPPNVPDHTLLRKIGGGSYGEVWLARNVMGTYRAVKVVYRSRFSEPRPYEREFEGIQRFEPISREHPGLVDVLQVGCDDANGFFYYIMELADDEIAEVALDALEPRLEASVNNQESEVNPATKPRVHPLQPD